MRRSRSSAPGARWPSSWPGTSASGSDSSGRGSARRSAAADAHHWAMSRVQPPLGIYLHVPFCAARCGYCDFNTYVPDGSAPQEGFVRAALLELRRARAELGARPVTTVFFGGGTPTLLGAAALARMLSEIRVRFEVAEDAEVTTEANPESVDPPTLRRLREAGFTRISLGMQSS